MNRNRGLWRVCSFALVGCIFGAAQPLHAAPNSLVLHGSLTDVVNVLSPTERLYLAQFDAISPEVVTGRVRLLLEIQNPSDLHAPVIWEVTWLPAGVCPGNEGIVTLAGLGTLNESPMFEIQSVAGESWCGADVSAVTGWLDENNASCYSVLIRPIAFTSTPSMSDLTPELVSLTIRRLDDH